MRFYLILIFTHIFGASFAQMATLSGTVTDAKHNNETLPAVSISLKNSSIGTLTNLEGDYSLELASGEHTLVFNYIGYQSVEVPITVKSGEHKILNQQLNPDSISIEEVVISVVQSREKETALLAEQHRSVGIKQNIGAQELERKGLGDVATAVSKTSGISKQEGSSNVYVRGLGDRYNSTSINGLPVPSNDPEKKNIDLGLFTTDIIEAIAIDKVYNARISGDFAGGNVNIASKNYKGNGMFEASLGSSINTNAIQVNPFMLQDGPNKIGFSDLSIPKGQGYFFRNRLNPVQQTPIGTQIGLKGGKSFDINENQRVYTFATIGFDSGFDYHEGINQSVDAHGGRLKSFSQDYTSYKTNTTGMLNIGYKLNENHKIGYNLLFVNSSDQKREQYKGYVRDLAENDNGLIQRGTYVQNTLWINQLLGSHALTSDLSIEWGASLSTVEGNMPDRTQNTLVYKNNLSGYAFGQNTVTDNHRYFQQLSEDEWAAQVVMSHKINSDEQGESRGKISVGYDGRSKNRNFKAIQFNLGIPASYRETLTVDPNNLDAFFNQENYSNGLFTISSYAGGAYQTYEGEQDIHAGLLSVEYKLTSRLSTITGFRFENIKQNVSWKTQLDASGGKNTFKRSEILPSLVLKYELNDLQNLRFGVSKTYTLPQFKERALFIYEDVTEIKVGNPDLYPSQNYNVDVKWEMFPKPGELYALTAFGKYILDPINETTLASSTNDISFINTGDYGYVFGIEAEVRQTLFDWDQEQDHKLTAGLNLAFMKTHQDLSSDKVRKETRYNINLTDSSSGFTGASDLLFNTDLSYTKSWKEYSQITATLAYSYASDKLYALGSEGKGNQVDKAIGALDFILKAKFGKHFGVSLSAKNILNPEIKRVQENHSGDELVRSYKKGAYLGLGVSYQL